MKQLIQYQMEDGSEVSVEISEAEAAPPDVVPAGLPRRGAEQALPKLIRASQTFEEACGKVMPVLHYISARLRELRPDEVTVQLGITFTAQAGAVLAAASSEANLNVTLKWQKASTQTPASSGEESKGVA